MADKTGIEWTDATWNPVTGCSKVSAGCKHCYAEREWPRMTKLVPSYAGRDFTDVRTHADRLDQPIRWKKPRMIFVNSMSDLFHEDVSDYFLDQVFAVMALSPQHTFQVLTKRAKRMREYMREGARASAVFDIMRNSELGYWAGADKLPPQSWPLPNVWLGVSVEDQAAANERIPLLLNTPAAVRWISAEPLLCDVDISDHLWGRAKPCDDCPKDADCVCGFTPRHKVTLEPALHWVVVGGESGPKARPMHPAWARSLRDQCADAGVPFLMKQMHNEQGKLVKDIAKFPADLQAREYPR